MFAGKSRAQLYSRSVRANLHDRATTPPYTVRGLDF